MNQKRHHSHPQQNNPNHQHSHANNHNHSHKRRRPHDHNRPHKHHRGNEQRNNRDFSRSPGPNANERRYEEPTLLKLPLRRFAILFYDTFAQAKADSENQMAKAKEVDQLNIVIKAEGDQNDPELNKYGKVFAGEAWHLIHTRRVEEGWYNEPR